MSCLGIHVKYYGKERQVYAIEKIDQLVLAPLQEFNLKWFKKAGKQEEEESESHLPLSEEWGKYKLTIMGHKKELMLDSIGLHIRVYGTGYILGPMPDIPHNALFQELPFYVYAFRGAQEGSVVFSIKNESANQEKIVSIHQCLLTIEPS